MSRRRESFQPYRPLDDTVIHLAQYGQRTHRSRVHPLTVDRRRRAHEQNLRIAAWFSGFCWGVVALLILWIGSTVVYCASSGRC